MTALRWAAAAFLLAGVAAAPLNLLHARWFSGAELARVPLVRPLVVPADAAPSAQAYPPLILSLKPEQSPVAIFLESQPAAGTNAGGQSNRYRTHLISGSQIAAKAEALLNAPGSASTGPVQTLAPLPLLYTRINTPGVYTVLVSEASAPAFALASATLTVRANTRRADIVNVLAGIAFMLIGAVTLFATSKRRIGTTGRR